ncbi:hypothetical protein F4821DRAFT_275952 [Hypoxylon rubiginosum]|uniref:Uncharacterized protein n=1 Tax=Hypoxylon rubiginosum TaxID=110542 RepID=A0ACC0DA06_9PEZI|nr:hypothetical protein F4821DRAFT_275952 [Hypoxylon rubiginosum]
MATTATGIPEAELEEGQLEPGNSRKISYISDITFKIIPSCALILIFFAAGGILLATLGHNEPIPHQGTVVISILLLTFFIIFFIGAWYLYIKKRYPPLTKGPDAPDRPPPPNESFRTILKRILTMLTEIHHRLCARKEPGQVEIGVDSNPAELEDPHRPISQLPQGHRTDGRSSNMTGNYVPEHTRSRIPVTPAATRERSSRATPTGPRDMPPRNSRTPYHHTIPEGRESYGNLGSGSIPYHNPQGRRYTEDHEYVVSPVTQPRASFYNNSARGPGYSPGDSAARMNANTLTQNRTPANMRIPAPSSVTQPPRDREAANGGTLSNLREGIRKWGGPNIFLMLTPENLCESTPARIVERLDEKIFNAYNYPLITSMHDFGAAKYAVEHVHDTKSDTWDFAPRKSSLSDYSTSAVYSSSSNSTRDIRTTSASSYTQSKHSSRRPRTASSVSGKASVVNQSDDEHSTGLGIKLPSRSKKRTFSGSSSYGNKQGLPETNRGRHYPLQSQNTDDESVIFIHVGPSPEKPVVQQHIMYPPTPPLTVSVSSTMSTMVPKVPPKIKTKVMHTHHRVPTVMTDYETDTDEQSFPSIKSDKPVITSARKEKSTATTRQPRRRRGRGRQWQWQWEWPVELVEKPWCFDRRGRKRYHRDLSYQLPKVPPRSSSLGFRSHFGMSPTMPSGSSTTTNQSNQ